jgi:hypothetical protein
MTTSGTTSFNLDLSSAIEEAYERAGRRMQGGYDYRTARRSIDIMMVDWANRGLNLWLVDQQSFNVTGGMSQFTLPADTIDVIECVWRTDAGSENQVDLTVNRISVSDYSAIPNKLDTGSRPLQFYINRLGPAPVMYLWPVADGSRAGQIAYWRLRRVQDAGAPATNTMDMPFRFLEAFVAGLAFHLAVKNPQLAPRISMLKQMYEESFALAAAEDRDRASVRLTPFIYDQVYG